MLQIQQTSDNIEQPPLSKRQPFYSPPDSLENQLKGFWCALGKFHKQRKETFDLLNEQVGSNTFYINIDLLAYINKLF